MNERSLSRSLSIVRQIKKKRNKRNRNVDPAPDSTRREERGRGGGAGVRRRFTWRESLGSSSRFSKSARLGAAVGRKGRPTGRPDGSESSLMPAACPNWIPGRCPDARTPMSDTPPCRGPRLAGTASVDSRLASRPPSPPPSASCNRIERRCYGLIHSSGTEVTPTSDSTYDSRKNRLAGKSHARTSSHSPSHWGKNVWYLEP